MSQYPITITGRLTKTPTLSKVNQDMFKVSFRVASSKRRKEEAGWVDADPVYLDVEAWGQFAINIRTSLEKGMPVVVVGSLCTQEWQDRETAQTRSRTIVKAQYVGLDLNYYVIGSKRISVTHNLAGVQMGDVAEQEFPIDQDFTTPANAGAGPESTADAAEQEDADSPEDSAADRRAAASGGQGFEHGTRDRYAEQLLEPEPESETAETEPEPSF